MQADHKIVDYEVPETARRIHDMPMRLRPREEFERLGAENVSDAVLLALILRTGAKGRNVVELANALLMRYGSLTALSRIPVPQLIKDFKGQGLGRVKAQMLKAALELSRRLAEERMTAGVALRGPEAVAELMTEMVRPLDREIFWMLPLNTRSCLVCPPVEISRGVLNNTSVHTREVFREAISRNSAALILVHNHPSGDPAPSSADIRLTKRFVEAGKLMDIQVLDHVIVCRPGTASQHFCSLRESGLVNF